MYTEKDLHSLLDTIRTIGTGILHNESDSPLKTPPLIVRLGHIDDAGQCWFSIPASVFSRFHEGRFPVRIDFYRKNIPVQVKVSGYAFRVQDQEELHIHQLADTQIASMIRKGNVLLKVSVGFAESKVFKAPAHARKRFSLRNLISQLSVGYNQAHPVYMQAG